MAQQVPRQIKQQAAPKDSQPAPPTPNDQVPPQKDLSRPSAEEIYTQVSTNARQELRRSNTSLGLSGFGGGAFMGLSALGTAIMLVLLGESNGALIISRMFYPVGFIVVMLGRSQLFTENTLYPVALVLTDKRELLNMIRLWAVVLPANIAGAFSFALLAAFTAAFHPAVVASMSDLGLAALSHPPSQIFWSGIIGGWIIALAAWLVSGSHSITGSVMVIWMLTFIIGLGNFAHCIATSCEILVTVLTHNAPWSAYPKWLGPAVLGNVCGGVGIVTILEYGQVIYGRDAEARTATLDS